ncbi:hypothetical protein DV735_g2038, partial [Chaetothyriales sp. CBS 134920]
MSRGAMYAKMAGIFTLCAVGGPILMYYVVPAEGELFKRFSPELQQRNLENRERRQREYEDFLGKLKEYSRSDKPIWQAAAEAEEKARQELMAREKADAAEMAKIREEMAREMRRAG